ncbi:MAG: hypothetical protein M3434_05805, partial [Gemmatimonadota bacterium]|nr:hypothetical protein [Gemmatimonadota bacterium]
HAWWPIVLAIVIGVGGLLLARALLKPDALRPAGVEPDYTSTPERVLYNKYWIDELYHAVVIRPVNVVSQVFYRVFDRGIIDGIVDGGARMLQGVGLYTGTRVQTGQTNTYAFVIIIGVLVVLGAFAL